jgi:hypothetical protein
MSPRVESWGRTGMPMCDDEDAELFWRLIAAAIVTGVVLYESFAYFVMP